MVTENPASNSSCWVLLGKPCTRKHQTASFRSGSVHGAPASQERHTLYFGQRKLTPAYTARGPSSSSIRSSWLYLARRSLRHGAPVLISPVRRPTTKSAMKESSVSPERWETMTPQPLRIDSVGIDGLRDRADLVHLEEQGIPM